MSIIKIKDKTFKTSIPEAQILERVKAVADRISSDLHEWCNDPDAVSTMSSVKL